MKACKQNYLISAKRISIIEFLSVEDNIEIITNMFFFLSFILKTLKAKWISFDDLPSLI